MTEPYLRRTQRPLEPVSLDPDAPWPSVDAAYAGALSALEGLDSAVGGYKIGGVNAGSRKAFNVEALYFGALAESEILSEPSRAPGLRLAEIKGEVEVALRIAADPPSAPDAALQADGLFDAFAIALEMPSSPVLNITDGGVSALIADRCGAGALLLGPTHPIGAGGVGPLSGDGDWSFSLEQNHQTLAKGGVRDLTDPPLAIGRAFVAEAIERGFPIRAGQWIATGGATPCPTLAPGAHVRVLWDGAAVLEFTVAIDGGAA